MINQDKWVATLPKINNRFNEETHQLDHNKWVNTIPKINTYGSIKKYSLTAVIFVSGLLLVSAVKNETRNLQKEINNLQTSINALQFNLDQAILDNEVITSPENISQLAKEHLNDDFVFYKQSQIKQLIYETEAIVQLDKKIDNKQNKSLSKNIKSKVAKKIKETKTEIRKIQELYSRPQSISGEIKTQVAKSIEEKRIKLKNLYSSPKDTITLQKAQKWTAVQIVKVFLGIPIVPGR